MPINTKSVQGRRSRRFESLDDMLADVERLESTEVRPLGNWSLGQILQHLSVSLNSSIDGFKCSVPAPLRFVMSLLLKKKFLYKSLPTGFKASGKFVPSEEVTSAGGLAALRKAVERQASVEDRVPHPEFGKIPKDEWTEFHLRHAEMHLSFINPAEAD